MKKLFVGDLPKEKTKKELEEMIRAALSDITSGGISVLLHQESSRAMGIEPGTPKGFAFVTVQDEDSERAAEMLKAAGLQVSETRPVGEAEPSKENDSDMQEPTAEGINEEGSGGVGPIS